ncbi:MAG: DUF4079 domain-containing protein [Kamptonema sp. SIO4C4]|nr:DUF4079 domain-containing protein [Kamptonema sp. SIO4C4]
MDAKAWAALIHPAIAVLFVFPLLGIVINFALQTRQRRLAIAAEQKTKIPPVVGREHLRMGRWLTGGVVGVSLVAIAYSIIFKSFLENQLLQTNPFQGIFIIILFALTIACLVLLYRARQKFWRVTFVTLTSMGLIILGFQDGVFRRTNEWYMSHFYYGIAASILMVISLAIVQEIYQDKSLKWRKAHIILNSIASLLFFGQGLTGVRDLFEIGLYTPPPQ